MKPTFTTHHVFLILLCFISISQLHSQRMITGKVMDGNNALIGASVISNGSQQGALTDFDGMFNLLVDDMDTELSISYQGYCSQVITLDSRSNYNVILESCSACPINYSNSFPDPRLSSYVTTLSTPLNSYNDIYDIYEEYFKNSQGAIEDSILVFGDKKSYFISDQFAHFVVSTLPHIRPEVIDCTVCQENECDNIKCALEKPNRHDNVRISIYKLQGSNDPLLVCNQSFIIPNYKDLELLLELEPLLTTGENKSEIRVVATLVEDDCDINNFNCLDHCCESDFYEFTLYNQENPDLAEGFDNKRLYSIYDNPIESYNVAAVPLKEGELKSSELSQLRIRSNNIDLEFSIIDTFYWQKKVENITDPYVKWIKLLISKPDLQGEYILTKVNSQTGSIVPVNPSIALNINTLNQVEFTIGNEDFLFYPEISVSNNSTDLDLTFSVDEYEVIENNALRTVYKIAGYFEVNDASECNKIIETRTIIYHDIVNAQARFKHQFIFSGCFDDYGEDGYTIRRMSGIIERTDNRVFNSLKTVANSEEYVFNSLVATKRDTFKGGPNSTIDQTLSGFFSSAYDNSRFLYVQFQDFHKRFPNQIKVDSNQLSLNAWPEDSEILNSFEESEYLEDRSFYNLLYMHTNRGRGLEFGLPESVKNKYSGEGYYIPANDDDQRLEISEIINEYNYVSPEGTSIALNFNMKLSEDEFDLSTSSFNQSLLLPQGNVLSVSNVEGPLYNPVTNQSVPLLAGELARVWSTYKNLVWDNHAYQYGKFTYGIPHDNIIFSLEDNNEPSFRPNALTKSIDRPWSFSHYRGISTAWINMLLRPNSEEYAAVADISEAFKNIGTINNEGDSLGYMKHGKSPIIPWDRVLGDTKYERFGHAVDPMAHFYNYLIGDDYISKVLYEGWSKNFHGFFKTFGGEKENTTTSLAMLDLYSNSRSAESLLTLSMGMNSKKANTLLDYSSLLATNDQWAYYSSDWLEKHLAQFRDTARVKQFLIDFTENTPFRRKLLSLKFRILYDKLFPSYNDIIHSQDVIYNHLCNALTLNYNSDNTTLNGFGWLRGLYWGSSVIKDLPYLIQYVNSIDNETHPFLLSQNNYSNYPHSPGSNTYNNQTVNIYYYPDVADINNVVEIDRGLPNNTSEKFQYYTSKASLIDRDDFSSYVFNKKCVNSDVVVRKGIDFSSVSNISQYLPCLSGSVTELGETNNTVSIPQNNVLVVNLKSNYRAPIFKNLSNPLSDNIEVFELFGMNLHNEPNCFEFGDCGSDPKTNPRYRSTGFNTYYFNTPGDGQTIRLRLENGNKGAFPFYYKIIGYAGDQNINEIELQRIATDLKNRLMDIKSTGNYIGNNDFIIINDLYIKEGIVGILENDEVRIELPSSTNKIPFGLIVSSVPDQSVNMYWDVEGKVFPENNVFGSTDIFDLIQFISLNESED